MIDTPGDDSDLSKDDPAEPLLNQWALGQVGPSWFRRAFAFAVFAFVAAGLLRTIGRAGWSWPPSIEAVSVIILLPAVIIYQAAPFFYRLAQRKIDSSPASPRGDSRKQH